MIKYVPIPREKNITTLQTTTVSIHYSCVREGGGGCKDLGKESEISFVLKINF